MNNTLINIVAISTLISSIFVITSKNPVISVTFLISVFCNAAGYLILTGIGFIGISYILLYVGAIIVLFLFVIMMIDIKIKDILETGTQYTQNLPLAFIITTLFFYEFFNILPFTFNNVPAISSISSLILDINEIFFNINIYLTNNVFNTFNPANLDTTFTNFLQIQAIGHGLYTYGASLLFVCSIILLLGMTAPIFISRKSKF